MVRLVGKVGVGKSGLVGFIWSISEGLLREDEEAEVMRLIKVRGSRENGISSVKFFGLFSILSKMRIVLMMVESWPDDSKVGGAFEEQR